MNLQDTYVAIILRRAEQSPNKIIYRFLDIDKNQEISLCYKELHERAMQIATALLERKLKGKTAILIYPPGLEYIIAFFGCLYAGVIAVPAYPPISKRTSLRLKNMIEDCHAAILLTNTLTLFEIKSSHWVNKIFLPLGLKKLLKFGDIEEFNINNIKFLCTDAIKLQSSQIILPKPDQVAFLQYTSGSAGGLKGVMVSHENLYHNAIHASKAMRFSKNEVIVSWLPPYHDMGLIGGIMQPLFIDGTSIIFSPFSFIKDPISWLRTISKYRATISGGPNFSYALCVRKIKKDELEKLDLSNWLVALNGAEPIHLDTINDFYQTFSTCGFKKESFFTCYGLAEATLMVSGNFLNNKNTQKFVNKKDLLLGKITILPEYNTNATAFVSSGEVVAGIKAIIVDTETKKICDDKTIGEIWLQGEAISHGYWNKPEINNEIFDCYTSTGEGPYFKTGDLGFIVDNKLFITGRIKDIIIIRGENYYPQDIEYAVNSSHPAIQAGSIAAFNMKTEAEEEVTVVAEIRNEYKNYDDIIEAIRKNVAKECDLTLDQIYFIKRHSILKTSSGKIQRSACKQAIEKNELPILYHWKWHNKKSYPKRADPTLTIDNEKKIKEIINWLQYFANHHLNSVVMDERRCISPYVILNFAKKGLFGLKISKDYGGLGLNHHQAMQIIKQLSAINLTLGVFVGLANANIQPILKHASKLVRENYVPLLAKGQDFAAFALTESEAGSNIHQIQMTAHQNANGWTLKGIKYWSGIAAWSSIIITFAKAYDGENRFLGVTAFAIPTNLPGIRQGEEAQTMGLKGIVQNTIYFDDVKISADYMLGKPGEGLLIAEEAMMDSRLGIAALCLGAMERCAQIATQYSEHRSIKTGSLINHGVCRTNLNDIHHAISVIQTLTDFSNKRLDDGYNVPIEVAMAAKILSTEWLWSSVDKAMQILGGRGYIETNVLPQIMRDARVMRIFEGTSEVLNDYIGTLALSNNQNLIAFLSEINNSKPIIHELNEILAKIKAQTLIDETYAQLIRHHLGLTVSYGLLSAILLTNKLKTELSQYTTLWLERLFKNSIGEIHTLLHNSEELKTSFYLYKQNYSDSIGFIEEKLPGLDEKLDAKLSNVSAKIINQTKQQNIPDQKKLISEDGHGLLEWIGKWLYDKKIMTTPHIHGNEKFNELGMDSVTAIAFIADLEIKTGISLPIDLIYEYNEVKDLVYYIEEHSHKKNSNQSEKQTNHIQMAVSESKNNHNYLPLEEIKNQPSLKKWFDDLIKKHGDVTSQSTMAQVVYPYIFIGKEQKGFFYCQQNGTILVASIYVGPDEYYESLINEVIEFAYNKQLVPLFITLENKIEVFRKRNFWASSIGVWQSIDNLKTFQVVGTKMHRLRYLINHYQKSGSPELIEYKVGSDKHRDNEIIHLIDKWKEHKKSLNINVFPSIDIHRLNIVNKTFDKNARLFLLCRNDAIDCAIILTHASATNSYHMDAEFYDTNAPLGGMDFGIVKIIELLRSEGCQTLSMGATYATQLFIDNFSHPDIQRKLIELHDTNIWNGDKNFQFKQKFHTKNTTIYLCQPKNTGPFKLTDIFNILFYRTTPHAHYSTSLQRTNIINSDNIVKLNKNESGQYLFCIHPIGGNVLCYYQLAHLLENKYAVYGIQSVVDQSGKMPYTSVENMSEYYINEIKKIQPNGPYALLGWSMGGFVAFEMARQLTQAGKPVHLLALIDVGNSEKVRHIEDVKVNTLFKYLVTVVQYNLVYSNAKSLPYKIKVLIFLLKHMGLSLRYFYSLLPILGIKSSKINFNQLKKYTEMIKHDFSNMDISEFPIKDCVSFLKENNVVLPNVSYEMLDYFYDTCRKNFYAMQHVELKPYSNKVILFSAKEHDSDNEIEKICLNKKTIYLPVNHYNILKDHHSLNMIANTLESIDI